jgi:hypothetical protein
MKTKALLLLLLGILATTGSTCINDGFLVAVNLPISNCFSINSGPTLSFSGSLTIKLADQIDASYLNKIKAVRYYDVRVSVQGTYTGSVSGSATINDVPLLTYTGQWSDFATAQSLLGSSTHITSNATGVAELVRVLNLFKTDQTVTVKLSSTGSLSGQTPVPAGLSVCVEILAQVDAEVN